MNNSRVFIIGIALLAFSYSGYGQSGLSNRVIVGGNLGLQFGNVTLIDVSPTIGYMLSPHLVLGLGGTYKYYSYKNYDTRYNTSYYGGSTFIKYYLSNLEIGFLRDLYLHAEYELLNYRYDSGAGYDNERVLSYFVGGGYRAPVSDKVDIHLSLLYNLNDTKNSPYENPVFRIGFAVRL